MNVIQTICLTRRFNDLVAVDQIDLAVPEASIYGFLGPNGAGKTTTIRMLLGLIQPNSGNLSIFLKEYRDSRIEILKRIGSLVEQPSMYPHLTGWENLEIIRRLRDLERLDISKALQIVNLVKDSRRLVKYYSTGMRQRLGLAMALMGMPPLLILDEPTNGLDPAGIHEIRALITQLPRKYGITVFLSSHLLSEVEQIATRIGIINKGRLIFQGSQEDLQSQMPKQVIIDLDHPDKAEEILVQEGRKIITVDQSHISVQIDGKADAAGLLKILMSRSCAINEWKIEKPSLEDLFLELTEPHERSR